jgi:hypothetical protein
VPKLPPELGVPPAALVPPVSAGGLSGISFSQLAQAKANPNQTSRFAIPTTMPRRSELLDMFAPAERLSRNQKETGPERLGFAFQAFSSRKRSGELINAMVG